MSTIGDACVDRFLFYAGPHGYTFMETWGDDQGPTVNRWEALWGLKGEEWCGMAEAGVIREVTGGWAAYHGADFLSPSVAEIARHGANLGWRWDGSHSIPPGAIVTYTDKHTTMVVVDHGPLGGVFTSVGGNESRGVMVSERSTYGARIWIPPAVAIPPVPSPEFDYGMEDVRAKGKQFVITSYLSMARRNKRLLALTEPGNPYNAFHPRPHRIGTGLGTRYLIIGGPVRYYGPYDTKVMRTNAKRILVTRLRRFWKLTPQDIVLRDYRVPEQDYLAALEARREWIAKYGG